MVCCWSMHLKKLIQDFQPVLTIKVCKDKRKDGGNLSFICLKCARSKCLRLKGERRVDI